MPYLTSKQLKEFGKLEDELALKSRLYNDLRDKYQSPPGYANWNKILKSFAFYGEPEYIKFLRETAQNDDIGGPICAGMAAYVAANLDASAVYLTQELTEALVHTNATVENPPELVLPCFFICLPKGIVCTRSGSSITSILVHIPEAVESVIPEHLEFAKRSRVLEAISNKKGHLYIAAVGERRELFSSITGWNYEDGDNLDEDMSNMLTKVERIVKNVILIYNYQRSLISTIEPTPTSKGFGKRQERETRSPLPTTFLGKNFLVRRPNVATQCKNQKTTTKRPHWRKGHWHTVLTGAGRKQRRLKWFQPVYINASVDT